MASIYWHLKNIGEIQEKANQKKVLIIKKSKKKGFFLPCPMPWGMHGELAVKSFIPGKKRKKKKYSLLLSFWESCDLVYFGKKAFFIILYQTFKKSLFIMHLIILYCYIILQYIIYIIFLFKNRIFSYVMLITCNAFYVSNFHRYCHCHLQIGYCSETVFYLIHLRYFTFKTQSPKNVWKWSLPFHSFHQIQELQWLLALVLQPPALGHVPPAGKAALQSGCCYQAVLFHTHNLPLASCFCRRICTYTQFADFEKFAYIEAYVHTLFLLFKREIKPSGTWLKSFI